MYVCRILFYIISHIYIVIQQMKRYCDRTQFNGDKKIKGHKAVVPEKH